MPPELNAQQPAAPAQPDASSVQMADPEAYVERNVFGKRELIPVKALIQENQTFEAGKQMLEQARQSRSEMHLDREHAERWRTFERQLLNPQTAPQAIQGMQNMARAAGVDVSSFDMASAVPGGYTDQDTAPNSAASDPKTRGMDQRIAKLEEREHQAIFRQQLSEVMNTYFPNFDATTKEGVALRGLAEQQVMAAQVASDGQKTLQQCAREVSTSFADAGLVRAGNPPTAERDARRQAQQFPHVSPNVGTQPLGSPPNVEQADGKGLMGKGNDWAKGTREYVRNLLAGLGPQPPQ